MLDYMIESGNIKASDRNYLMRSLKERIERLYNKCLEGNTLNGSPKENHCAW